MHDMENSSQQSVAGSQQPFMDDGSATLVPYFQDESVIFYLGDSLAVLPSLAENSMDACVTDPPYELGFMGKAWDNSGIAYNVDLWRLVFRALKPGAHLLAFGGSRTYHRMACAIEDAGFEIRDQIQWIYGSGFPKSLDVSKAIDKMNGDERPVVGVSTAGVGNTAASMHKTEGFASSRESTFNLTSAASAASAAWDGWGTALKPAHEPIVMARKPLEKGLTVAQNVLKWRTGAINIDKCRVEFQSAADRELAHTNALGPVERSKTTKAIYEGGKQNGGFADTHSSNGRFPANVIHDGSDEVVSCFPNTSSGLMKGGTVRAAQDEPSGACYGVYGGNATTSDTYADQGSAARFFYSPKASKADREADLDGHEVKQKVFNGQSDKSAGNAPGSVEDKFTPQPARNYHPTVKPFDLMQYLCRLVTPPGGTILEPFLGSGSTAKAATSALIDGFKVVGIELNEDYMQIAQARFNGTPMRLF